MLSLQFGVPGLGLPGLEMPWNQRHAKQTDLSVILVTPTATAESVPQAQPPLPPLSEAMPDKPSRPAGFRLYPQRTPAPTPESRIAPRKTAKVAKAAPPKRISTKPARPKPTPPVIARADTEDSTFKVPEPSQAEPENNPAPVEKPAEQPEATPAPPAEVVADTAADRAADEAARREEEQRAAQETAAQQARDADATQRAEEAAHLAARSAVELEQQNRDEEARQAAIAREQQDAEQKRSDEASRIAREAEERRTEEAQRLEEAARAQREARELEAQRQTEENARRQAEATARRQAELARQQALQREQEEAIRRADEAHSQDELRKQEELRLAEEEARRQAELKKQEEQRQAQELARRQAEEAAARAQAEELARRKQAEELAERQRAEELAARRKAEADAAAARREQERLAAAAQAASQQANTARGLNGERPAQGTLPRGTTGGDLAAHALNQLRGIDTPRLDTQSSRPMAEVEEAPRRASILGRAPQDVGLAMYVEGWKLKIERMGRLNYTQSSVDKSLVDAVVTVIIRSDGSVQDIHFHRNTGRKELDDAIRRIIHLNERYASFPPDLARRYDTIEIRRVWNFDDRLRILEEMKY